MKVKKYEADNMQEALLKIKSDIGQDAVILHTRKFKKGGILRWFAKEKVEVLAAAEEETLTQQDLKQEMNERFKLVQNELVEIKSFIHTLIKQMKPDAKPLFSPDLEELYLNLLQNEVEEKLALKLIKAIADELKEKRNSDPKQLLIERISNMIGEPQPIKLENHTCKTVALIGPTGVGKTTTLAKIAAIFRLQKEKRVAFVSADTYRLAAVDQLKKYAEIMGIPLEIAFTPEDLRIGITKHSDKDLILIDTVGHSQKNLSRMYELKDFIEAARPAEIHLVLSLTTRFVDQLDVIQKFSIVPINQFVFTKLDETTCLGSILNVISNVNKSISYITNGQNVPEDIEEPTPKELAKLIVG